MQKILADNLGTIFSYIRADEMKEYHDIIKKWVDRGKICQLMDHYDDTESLTDTLIDDLDEVSWYIWGTSKEKASGKKWKGATLKLLYDASPQCGREDDEEEKKKCYDKNDKVIPCPPDLTLPVDQDSHILRNIKNREIWPRFPGYHNACCSQKFQRFCSQDKRRGIRWIASCITRKGKDWDLINPKHKDIMVYNRETGKSESKGRNTLGVGEWNKEDVEKCWCVPRDQMEQHTGEFNIAGRGEEPETAVMSYWRYNPNIGGSELRSIDPLKFSEYKFMTGTNIIKAPSSNEILHTGRTQKERKRDALYAQRSETGMMLRAGTPDTEFVKWIKENDDYILDALAIATLIIPVYGVWISTAIDLVHAAKLWNEGDKVSATIYAILPLTIPILGGTISKLIPGKMRNRLAKTIIKYDEHLVKGMTKEAAYKKSIANLPTDQTKKAFEYIIKNPNKVKNQLLKHNPTGVKNAEKIYKEFIDKEKILKMHKQSWGSQTRQHIKRAYINYFRNELSLSTRIWMQALFQPLIGIFHEIHHQEKIAEDMVEESGILQQATIEGSAEFIKSTTSLISALVKLAEAEDNPEEQDKILGDGIKNMSELLRTINDKLPVDQLSKESIIKLLPGDKILKIPNTYNKVFKDTITKIKKISKEDSLKIEEYIKNEIDDWDL